MACFTVGCGEDEMMVLTPYGDAVIKDDGSAGNAADEISQGASEQTAEAQTPDDTQAEENTASSDLIHVGFAQVGAESDWRLAQTASMKQTFTEEAGYELDFVDCNGDQQAQIAALERFISDGADYIVLDPIVETGYDDILQKAKDADIPVIIVDRNIAADESLYSCWVGSDFVKEGEDAASWLKEYLSANGKDSEDINIVTIQGTVGASAQLGRSEGFNHSMAANWTMLDEQSGDFTEDGGRAVMAAFLNLYDDIDVVICQNDNEAYGAIDAMDAAGVSYGPGGDMIVISFDATKGGFERMINGQIHVDVECNPLEGPLVAELIQKLENGENIEKIQYVEEAVFPADTAADMIDSRAY